MAAARNGVKQVAGKPAAPERKVIMPVMPPPEDTTAEREQDFSAFWDSFRTKVQPKTTNILGVDVVIPTDVPLAFEDLQERMAASKADVNSPEAHAMFKEMLVTLFGEGTYEQWRANGLTALQLRVLVVWGMLNGNGNHTTFERAGEIVLEELAEEAAGKAPAAPNRASRRAAAASSRTRASATTGQRSKRTSSASTRSKRTS